MTLLRKAAKAISLLVGIGLCMLGITWVLIGVSGEIATGPLLGYVAGTGFIVVAGPFLAYPFSAKIAKVLGVSALCAFAAAILWLAFQPDLPDTNPALAQTAAIAFAGLLFARVGLALRRRKRQTKLGT
jgi:hypothetical protein